MFMSECSISDKVDNWMYRLHFNVLFLDRNNPNLIISARMSWPIEISCGHTTDFYLGKPFLPRANSSKIYLGKFISGFVLPG